MAATIRVPINTSLADLDESLRTLVRRELRAQGFDGVDVSFGAPSRDWAATLSGPTVAMFLYDLREAPQLRRMEWSEQRVDGRAWRERPPVFVDCSYSVTAWTPEVEDEHRLLSQVLGILLAFTELPADVLAGKLGDPALQPFPVRGRLGDSAEGGRADFWTALGGQYKVSVDYVATLACPTGTRSDGGPPVRVREVASSLVERPRTAESAYAVGGTISDDRGSAVEAAWIVLPDVGRWAASDADGRFSFDAVPAGRHRCSARDARGRSAGGELVVPGPGIDLVLGSID